MPALVSSMPMPSYAYRWAEMQVGRNIGGEKYRREEMQVGRNTAGQKYRRADV